MKIAVVPEDVVVAGLAACIAHYGRGELPPPWLAFSTCAAVLALAVLALVDVWRQS
jgi:hypothetical protein